MAHQLTIEYTVMGGWLSNPVETYPNVFGGPSAARWLVKYPYALPMVANFFFMVFCATLVAVGLEEVCLCCLC